MFSVRGVQLIFLQVGSSVVLEIGLATYPYPTFLFATNTVGGVQFNRAGAAKFAALPQSENREFTTIIDTPHCHVAEGKLTIPKHAMKIPCQYPGGDLQMCEETYGFVSFLNL